MDSGLRREISAVFVFSVAILALELTYTKLFSVVFWYHFGFVIVSNAMLGFAASGVALALLGERAARLDLFRLLTWSGWALLGSYALLTRLPYAKMGAATSYEFTLILAILLVFVPFFFLGLTVSWVLRERAQRVGSVYAANLAGSALGALFFLWMFDHFPGEVAIFLDTLIVAAAAAVVASSLRQWARLATLAAVTLACIVMVDLFPIRPGKNLRNVQDPAAILYTGWSSLSRVDVIDDPDSILGLGFGLWGLTPLYYEEGNQGPERLGVVIDAHAFTSLLRYPQDLSFYDRLPPAFVYQLGREFRRSLHLGAGGGMDLLAAQRYGVPEIHGVEINPKIVEAIQTEFDEYAGGIYTGGIDGIQIHVDEGRSFLERTTGSFDLIQLSGIDTHASTQAGAFALSENNLYTKEAFISYLDRLTPEGILTLKRWYMPDASGRKTLSLRLTNLMRESLAEAGIDPRGRVILFRTTDDVGFTVLVISLRPFSPDELTRAIHFIEYNGYIPMLLPGRRLGNVYEKFLYAAPEEYQKLVEDYPYSVAAPTDDWPFFFEMRRPSRFLWGGEDDGLPLPLSGQDVLRVAISEALVLSALFLLLPLDRLRRTQGIRVPAPAALYFALIGYAYISIEIVLSQKLVLYLGHPAYALSVVLAGMLLFSGIGSALSERWRQADRLALAALLPVLAIVVIAMQPALDASLRAPLGVRVGTVLGFIAPIGILMGFPFPIGVRRVARELVPYLWGVNGFLSVLGSVVAVAISTSVGFRWVLMVAGIAYAGASALGLFLLRPDTEG